ncbi:MAG: 6-phosphogluconolactonase [Pauljensenia sp.]
MPDLRVYPGPEELGQAVADALVGTLTELLGRVPDRPVDLALAGGSVNSLVLERLRGRESVLDWSRVRVWWVDERFVPAEDPRRNDKAAREALLDGLPGVQLRPMPADDGTRSLERATADFAFEWHAEMGGRSPDLAIVGTGEDGHFASLFPGHPQVDATESVVAEPHSPKPPPLRISLARDVVTGSGHLWLVAAGGSKARPVAQALEGADVHDVPVAALARPGAVWWLDEAAARLLA